MFKSTMATHSRIALIFFMIILVYGYLEYNIALMAAGSLFMIAFTYAFRRFVLTTSLTMDHLVILSVVLTMTLTLPIAMYRNAAAPLHYGIEVFSILSAYVISKFSREACKAVGVTLFILQIATLAYLFTTDIAELPLDHMFEAGGSNGITSVLILLQAVYAGLSYNVHRKAVAFSSFVTLYICVAGYSRGSILAGTAICFLVMAVYLHNFKSLKWRLSAYFLTTPFILYLSSEYFDDLLNFTQSNTKFMLGFVDMHRELIIKEYIGKIDWLTFFIGADFSNTSIQDLYNNNPHSSLIRAHHLFGLPYLVAIFFAAFSAIFSSISSRKKIDGLVIHMAFILIILVRSISEPILFPTPMDFFVFLLIFVGNSSQSKALR